MNRSIKTLVFCAATLFAMPAIAEPAPRPAIPDGNPGNWVRENDYPDDASKAHAQGVTGFRLLIGLDGKVTGCEITASSGYASLDQATCRILTERAQFKPARDRKGNPVAGSWSSRFRWVYVDRGPQTVKAMTTVETFIVEPDGTPSNCQVTREGMELTDAKSPSVCALNERFTPFRNHAGSPVRKKVIVTRTVAVSDPD